MSNLALAFSYLMEINTGLEGHETWGWVHTVANAIYDVLWPILIVVGAAGMIYAIIIGVNMARADSTEKKEEAKKRLINVIVGLVIIIALILFMQLFISQILPTFVGTDPSVTIPDNSTPTA